MSRAVMLLATMSFPAQAAAQIGREAPAGTPVQLAAADLVPLNGLRLASTLIQWGQTRLIAADAAASTRDGRCEFRYHYVTANQGSAASGPATNLILLNSPTGPELAEDAVPALPAGAQHASSGTLWLRPGMWTIYVHADGRHDVSEADEQNNVQRVSAQVRGGCN